MKIVMVGPVYPYKTGLSYYVALLYKQLSIQHDVTLLSYSMQYPKIMYKKPQKDFEDDVLKIDDVEYVLNTASPFSCIKVAKKINRISPDLVIFQWLHPYFAPCYSMISKRIRKSKILFMCHNVFPHERFPMDRFLTRMTLRRGDIFITHSNSDADDLKTILPHSEPYVTVHPAYPFFKQKGMTLADARGLLNLPQDAYVLLFFGLIREYKGLKHLLKALSCIKREDSENKRKVTLLIAGDFAGNRGLYEKQIESLGIVDMVRITDKHLPTDEVEQYFASCDLVVLPYESATQSGVIQVAYSFEKPVLATDVGGLPDVVFDGETGYVVEPKNPEAIAKAICDYKDNNRSETFIEGVRRENYRYSWEKMETVIMKGYENA